MEATFSDVILDKVKQRMLAVLKLIKLATGSSTENITTARNGDTCMLNSLSNSKRKLISVKSNMKIK